ncbi:N-acetylmuramic acid 6-phosphate etherase [Caldanaerobacter subterraneus subsp. tengcongensis MB4]|uniref:N-acetylmuramic acid 6-phosphate etherase n=2 Tax=Caldanaerobacter subterraneus TaxID=911092 RepID=MURQ_CALS4|nr:N-acetylmuramic acid 6-phosphate etherase [Caldanaerobacter subterraneus]Q8RD35.1 RecName: Full=N-acetylmuramic acid 6-phosphate etherase; Short=MurNAc-6-P etherase; AltName: Full=N-acetylmuramic acid 6-phosphate hydrolase; AltName: Full=N-acetylmuramic acid 6-phosphate lyase [Caldanaerobacter subterraneus subsp. tengcongensis MB4]AAM23513.1 predicted sugar phosphate isomerase [Caldanaerobacter subterraneus subsp. tengcongensis MB4]KKC30778.1 N-acetylmuramic acid-6-phosphate etherase [Caldana
MTLEELITEGRNPNTMDIDRLSTVDMLKKINEEDKKVPLAVEKVIPSIAEAIDRIVPRMKKGGRLIYVGAGTSGRIGILDASECPPTFGVDPGLVVGIIAGGDSAIRNAIESAEDDVEGGRQDLVNINLTERDSVIGISASGRTPYVIGALRYAKEVGALTIGLFCNENKNVENIVDVMITPIVGPEVIMGSTRMKAGTAQKLVLNMISTGVMIKLGKVYSNLMVDLQASNEKLRERARRMVKLATGAKEDLIERVLNETNYNVKLAILMIVGDMEKEKAQKLLEMADGYIAEAIKLKDLVLQGEE